MNKKLTAKVSFNDVDGNIQNIIYKSEYKDVCGILEYLGDYITDKSNFENTKNCIYPGLNGTVDISKPLNIVICLE